MQPGSTFLHCLFPCKLFSWYCRMNVDLPSSFQHESVFEHLIVNSMLINVCISMPPWHLMTTTLLCRFPTLNHRNSLLGIVPSAWTQLWSIRHCVGDPNRLNKEKIGTTKNRLPLVLWREIAWGSMWRLRGNITVLPHALIYLWVGLLRNIHLLNLLLYDSTLSVWKRYVLVFVFSIPLILDAHQNFLISVQWLAIKVQLFFILWLDTLSWSCRP